jgi:hypothetical protein
MSRPTYVYDVREQLTKPVLIVYDDTNLLACLAGLYGRPHWICDGRPDWLLVTKIRMHKTTADERYLDLPTSKRR